MIIITTRSAVLFLFDKQLWVMSGIFYGLVVNCPPGCLVQDTVVMMIEIIASKEEEEQTNTAIKEKPHKEQNLLRKKSMFKSYYCTQN